MFNARCLLMENRESTLSLNLALLWNWAENLVGLHQRIVEPFLIPDQWVSILKHFNDLRAMITVDAGGKLISVDPILLSRIQLNMTTLSRLGFETRSSQDPVANSWSLCQCCFERVPSLSVWNFGGISCGKCTQHIELEYLEDEPPSLPGKERPQVPRL